MNKKRINKFKKNCKSACVLEILVKYIVKSDNKHIYFEFYTNYTLNIHLKDSYTLKIKPRKPLLFCFNINYLWKSACKS